MKPVGCPRCGKLLEVVYVAVDAGEPGEDFEYAECLPCGVVIEFWQPDEVEDETNDAPDEQPSLFGVV